MMQASSRLHYPVVSSTIAKAMALSVLCIVFLGNVGLPRRSLISGTMRLKLWRRLSERLISFQLARLCVFALLHLALYELRHIRMLDVLLSIIDLAMRPCPFELSLSMSTNRPEVSPRSFYACRLCPFEILLYLSSDKASRTTLAFLHAGDCCAVGLP